MRIGEVARRVGVNPRTVRYYESIGLLPEPPRTDGGYRSYDEHDVERIAFVRRARQLDLSLDEIREVLALRDRGERPCGFVLQVARARFDELERRIDDMQRARLELQALLRRADHLSNDVACYCTLIEHEASGSLGE